MRTTNRFGRASSGDESGVVDKSVILVDWWLTVCRSCRSRRGGGIRFAVDVGLVVDVTSPSRCVTCASAYFPSPSPSCSLIPFCGKSRTAIPAFSIRLPVFLLSSPPLSFTLLTSHQSTAPPFKNGRSKALLVLSLSVFPSFTSPSSSTSSAPSPAPSPFPPTPCTLVARPRRRTHDVRLHISDPFSALFELFAGRKKEINGGFVR